MTKIVSFLRDESGASAAEYAIILAVIGGALVASLGILNGAMTGAMSTAAGIINPKL